jgi:hypothetical protein
LLAIISVLIGVLGSECKNHLHAEITAHVTAQRKKVAPPAQLQTLGVGTLLSLARPSSDEQPTLTRWVEDREQWLRETKK